MNTLYWCRPHKDIFQTKTKTDKQNKMTAQIQLVPFTDAEKVEKEEEEARPETTPTSSS